MKTKSIIAWTLLVVGTIGTACGDDAAEQTPPAGQAGVTGGEASPPESQDPGDPPLDNPLGPLRVVYRSGGVAFEADDPAWDELPARLIAMIPQLITKPGGGGATQKAFCRAMHDGEWFAVWLHWRDDTADQAVGLSAFRDSVAIGFPTTEGDRLPSPFMGEQNMPVNIWQWTADFDANTRGQGTFASAYPHTEGVWYFPQDYMVTREVRSWRGSEPVIELEARGFGYLERKVTQNVHGSARHHGTRWSVVLRRRLVTGNPQDVLFRPGATTNAIFAVWEGGSSEVNGMKSITPTWMSMQFDDTRAQEESR